MSDIGTEYKLLRIERQERHAAWYEVNRSLLAQSGLTYVDRGQNLLFRNAGKPFVDFYPSTGRWRIVGKDAPATQTFHGGAKAFLDWYQQQGDVK